jgi:hypothetical protein
MMILSLALAAAVPAAPGASDRSRTCPPPPALALLPEFKDPRRIFAPWGRAFRSVQKRFASAYWLACRSGALSPPLMPAGTAGSGRLFLRNAPDANTTSIYWNDRAGAQSRQMVMEHPFIVARGHVDIPSIDELRSAIVCSVRYSDPPPNPPAGDILECLPD